MSNTAGRNGTKRERTLAELEAELETLTLAELEAELERLRQTLAVIEREGFTDDRPLDEQFEERIKELREQIAKEQQEREQGHSADPEKPEEEDK